MNIAEWLLETAKLKPKSPAILHGETITADYETFARRAAGIATALRNEYGITSGDRVGIFMKNRPEYLEILYGIWWTGAVVVPINAKLHEREALWILNDAEVNAVFASSDFGDKLTSAGLDPDIQLISVDTPTYKECCEAEVMSKPVARADDDLSWLFYTSGTTGKPKGVMLSHGNLVTMSLCYYTDVDTVSELDCATYAAPMSHGAGMYNFIHIRKGARNVVPKSGGFDSTEILELAEKLGNMSMFAAPTMVKRLVDHCKSTGQSGQGIKTIVYGGGPMYVSDIIDAVDVLGARFVQIYGQGESPMTISALDRNDVANRDHPDWRHRLGSVGRAQSCTEIRILDENGNICQPGVPGEITVRGPQVMMGYWRNSKATEAAISDGWLRTGDIGSVDATGYLTLTDRSKDVIISGGTNIYPREVEEVLLTAPEVHEVCVVGKPHPEWGEEVVAFVVLNKGAVWDTAELDRHCNEQMARFKRPKIYIEMAALPKNNYGKIVKTELRETLKAREEEG